MKFALNLAVFCLIGAAATPTKADCEQCPTANLQECIADGEDVYCYYDNGSMRHLIRIRSKT